MQRFLTNSILLLVGCSVLLALGWSAAPAQAQMQPQTAGPDAEPIDVIVLLDDSGSMATCWPWPREGLPFGPPCGGVSFNAPSDPNELRYSAARLLVHLADAADRIAVVRFDGSAEPVGAMGLLQEVGGPENRRRLAASLQPPTNYLIRGYTRMDLGLEEALRLLSANREPNRSQYVLLLTDGEPTAPGTITNQRETISQQLSQLEEDGVLIYPVILCNPDAGCPGDFLRNRLSRVREAKTAPDVLRIFSEVFAEMKADRSVVTRRNANGNLAVSIREAHGAGEIAFVSPRAAITAVRRDGDPMLTQSLLADGNIDLNIAAGSLPAGEWVAETQDLSAFAVVQADSYPELIFPPPSAQDSPASVRYYPAGRSPLLVVRGAGPAASEPLLLNGTTSIPPLGRDDFGREAVAAVQLSGSPEEVTIQLGTDEAPLQLRRTFQLEARSDLPRAQVFSPSAGNPGILGDGSLQLEVGFGPGVPVRDVQATAYVTDITDDGAVDGAADGAADSSGQDRSNGQPVYQKSLVCQERTCRDSGFVPEDGRSYRVQFLLSAVADGVRFGDFAQAVLEVEPAVYLRGLPPEIDLAKMPLEGWQVTVQAGTAEEIGSLEGVLSLRRADTGELAREVGLNFSVDVPESGSQTATFRVEGLDLLRPGEYTGELDLSVFGPSGLPMDVQIRPAPSLPVALTVPRSVARIQVQEADFGELAFDTSPNFRLDETILLPVAYSEGNPFRLTVELAQSSCPGLGATAGELQQTESGLALPVRLQSQAPVLPGGCSGDLQVRGPSEDFDVLPAEIPYRLQIRGVEWSVTGGLNFGDLGLAGESATETLLLRFDGKTPFVVQVLGIAATGETADGAVTLDESFLEAPPVEIDGPPDANGFYEVPVTLAARRALPKDPLRGSFYSGDLVLGIAGLPNETRTVDVSFRSPTLYQRYVEWWLRPFYTFPLLLCTGPLFLLVLLVVVARTRSRTYSIDDEPEPVVTLPGQEPSLSPEPEVAFAGADFQNVAGPSGESAGQEVSWAGAWGDVSWGGGGAPAAEEPDSSAQVDSAWGSPANASGGANSRANGSAGDPWRSGW